MKLAFIVNEKAGSGRAKKVWHDIVRTISVEYVVVYTNYAGHAKELARELCMRTDNLQEQLLLVVIGGDGTINEVINGIAGYSHVCISSISAGSGNDFARGYNVFHDVQELEDFILKACIPPKVIDIGTVLCNNKKHFFMNNAGFGFDALVAKVANQSKLKRFLNYMHLGKLSYGFLVIKTLFLFRFFDVTVQQNDMKTTYKKCWFFTASNQPYFGGGMHLSPHSKTNDGLLELTIVHNLTRWKLLFVFITVYFGKHTKFREVVQLQGEAFEIMIHQPVIGHIDGELLDKTSSDEICVFTVETPSWYIAP